MKNLIWILALLFAFSACSKEEAPVTPAEEPVAPVLESADDPGDWRTVQVHDAPAGMGAVG